MKKLIFLASILTLFLIFESCKKDNFDNPVQDNIETIDQAISAMDISNLPADIQEMILLPRIFEDPASGSANSRDDDDDDDDHDGDNDDDDDDDDHDGDNDDDHDDEWCDDDDDDDAIISKEDVFERSTGNVVGRSKIERTDSGIRIKWRSNGHIPGDAVTLWIVIAAYDESCNPVFVDALWGGGKVISSNGKFKINTCLANGDNSYSILELFCAPGPGSGMENAYDFVIHLLTRNHGPYIEGSDQLTTFNDCNPLDSNFCEGDPPVGDGSCYDYQDSVHYPDCS